MHCLNNLLQGAYFTELDLASIGRRMDEEEKSRMAEGGTNSEEYKKFLSVSNAQAPPSWPDAGRLPVPTAGADQEGERSSGRMDGR